MTTPTDHAMAAGKYRIHDMEDCSVVYQVGNETSVTVAECKSPGVASSIVEALNAKTHAVDPAVRELVEALTPFAALLQKHHDHLADFVPVHGINGHEFTAGDLRHARALVAKYTRPTPSA